MVAAAVFKKLWPKRPSTYASVRERKKFWDGPESGASAVQFSSRKYRFSSGM